MTLNEACAAAVRTSRDYSCCVYVNGILRVDAAGVIQPINYYTSDWFNSDSTVRAYNEGKELSPP